MVCYWVLSCPVNVGHFLSTSAHNSCPLTRDDTMPGSSSSCSNTRNLQPSQNFSHTYRSSDLPHTVPLSQSGCVALESVEIHRHSERNPDLVRSGISSSDGPSTVVYLVGDAERLQTTGYTRREGGRQELSQRLKEKREGVREEREARGEREVAAQKKHKL